MDTFACILKTEALILDYYARKGLTAENVKKSSQEFTEFLKQKDNLQDSTLYNNSIIISKQDQRLEDSQAIMTKQEGVIKQFEIIYDFQAEKITKLELEKTNLELSLNQAKKTRNKLWVTVGALLLGGALLL